VIQEEASGQPREDLEEGELRNEELEEIDAQMNQQLSQQEAGKHDLVCSL
jgi:hypothetical protein